MSNQLISNSQTLEIKSELIFAFCMPYETYTEQKHFDEIENLAKSCGLANLDNLMPEGGWFLGTRHNIETFIMLSRKWMQAEIDVPKGKSLTQNHLQYMFSTAIGIE